eukprot:292453-Rhodomonas_salina.1
MQDNKQIATSPSASQHSRPAHSPFHTRTGARKRKASTSVSARSSTARTAAVEAPPRVLSKSRWRPRRALSKRWAPPTGTDSEAANLAA